MFILFYVVVSPYVVLGLLAVRDVRIYKRIKRDNKSKEITNR